MNKIISLTIYTVMAIPLVIVGLLFVLSVIIFPSKMNVLGRITSITVLKLLFVDVKIVGKIPRNHPNMRTDVAWVCALNATHHPIPHLIDLPDNSYDVGVLIVPKKRRPLLEFPLLEQYKRVCKKVTVMQESYYNYWQDSEIDEQIWYFNFLVEMDLIFCHNDIDLKYYNGITNVRTELLPTVMITDNIKPRDEWGDGVIIGGNWVRDYGFNS